ncbi:MAG TPA: hypothetical protein DCS93_20715 [Microscillaceae bacterium]|nr:hypothetical protein [Microscillaceae bacterium]
MTKHPIDKIFEEKLKDFEQMPRAAVWDKLNAQLDQKTPVSWWKRKVVWWSTGLSVTFLTIGLALWKPQMTPPPAQTAAKMVSLQMKLKGMPMSTGLAGRQAPQQINISKDSQENTAFDQNSTQNLALNVPENSQQNVKLSGTSQPKNGLKNEDKRGEKVTAALPTIDAQKKPVTFLQRKSLSEVELLSGAQGLKLAAQRDALNNLLPQSKAQPKITVTLKLSENMAGSRDQDEPDKGLKKIWKKLKGIGQENKDKKKTKKKRSGILKFLGDRDD